MKSLSLRILMGVVAAVSVASGRAFSYQTAAEIITQGDFDGDGRPDVAIIDRGSGAFRVGYQLSAGNYVWADPRASGAEQATGATVGKLLSTTRDSLAIVSVLANRVNMFDIPNTSGTAVPVSAYVSGIGPNQAIGINVGGSGDTAYDDLLVASIGDGGAIPGRLAMLRNNAGTTSPLSNANYPEVTDANRVVVKTGDPDLAGIIIRAGANDELRMLSVSTGVVVQALSIAPLSAGSRFVVGNFSGGAFRHILTFKPGETNFASRSASEPGSGVYAAGAPATINLGKPIAQLLTIPGATVDRVLALFQDGSATAYNFDGSSAPVVAQSLAADAGEKFTGAMTTGAGDFLMFSGTGTKSDNVRRYAASGSGYIAGTKVALPNLNTLTANANLFVFQEEPFVSGTPGLLDSLSGGDWTSDATVAGSPATITANVWDFLGSSNGLRNPVSVNFGPAPASPVFGLANQYAPSISIYSHAPAVGVEVVDLRISPDPREYKTAIKVTLTTSTPGASLFYRVNSSDPWTGYTGPVTLYRTTAFQYFGKPSAGVKKSRIHVATYTFPIDPAIQDSNHDGIPDYVEIAKGLDPNGRKDQDGDGFTDLNELIAGTNPLDASSVPADSQRLEEHAAFDLAVGLQPLDGTTVLPTVSIAGANVRAYDLSGSILRAGVTAALGISGVTDPAAYETNIVLDSGPPVVILGTDPHFEIATAGADKNLGRELIGILPVPRQPLPDVPYHLGSGALAAEANNWIASAQATYVALPREKVKANLDSYDSLTALLFERKVSQILLARGNPAGSNMTLFPFRPTDSGRTNPPATVLRSLEDRIDDTHPAFKLASVYAAFDAMVSADLTPLKDLTKEIYRISSASNNAAPAKYPSPIDTLRGVFETGVLNSNYAAVASVNLSAALSTFNSALSNVTERPTTNLDLVVRPDTFDGTCTRLDSIGLPAVQKTLLHPGGEQYRLLEAFNLVPGSHIHVFGYTDVANPECSGDAIEVIALALDSVPETTAVDTDGDLMLDALEFLMFGSLSNSGLGDADGDGFSNLQEMLDGTDPLDTASHSGAPVSLAPPSITITEGAGGSIHLSFDWPAAYDGAIHFAIKSTTTLGTPFTTESITPVNTGGNHFEATLPAAGDAHKFYLVSMSIM